MFTFGRRNNNNVLLIIDSWLIQIAKMYQFWIWILITLSICMITDAQVLDGPIIVSPRQSEIVLENNQNFTLICKGKTPINFKQQEVQEEQVTNNFSMQQRYLNSPSSEYPYLVALELYNVNQFALGYYACFDETIDSRDVLRTVNEEPQNTAHITYTYVYVNGSEHLIAPVSEYIQSADEDSEIVIRCRPMSPDVNLSLLLDSDYIEYERYNPKIGFFLRNDIVEDVSIRFFNCCTVKKDNSVESIEIIFSKHASTGAPNITADSEFFLDGETFTLNCTINYPESGGILLDWVLPPNVPVSSYVITTNDKERSSATLYNAITFYNATKEFEGTYTCKSISIASSNKNRTFTKHYLDKPFLSITNSNNDSGKVEYSGKVFSTFVVVKDYPAAEFSLFKNNKQLLIDQKKYKIVKKMDRIWIGIYNITVEDTANYTLKGHNKYLTDKYEFQLKVKSSPVVHITASDPVKSVLNQLTTLVCEVKGYPLPTVEWIASNKENIIVVKKREEINEIYKLTSYITLRAKDTSNLTCFAYNGKRSNASDSRTLYINEIIGGFGVRDADAVWFPQHQNISKDCIGSIYDYANVTWLTESNNKSDDVTYYDSKYSHVATLNLNRISLDDAGEYKCTGIRHNMTIDTEIMQIMVEPAKDPTIKDSTDAVSLEVFSFQPVTLICEADGVPQPVIEWHKDGEPLINSSNTIINTQAINRTYVNSTVEIKQAQAENNGQYECIARNQDTSVAKTYHIALKDNVVMRAVVIVAVILILLLIILITWLIWKIRKEKQFKRELKAAGLYFFKKGQTMSLNPDLMIDEQAGLLPYDEKYEFPQEKLIIGKQLGAGAFGVVYKAIARGIIDAEESTTVAVKVVKKTADNQCIKALASELKIMVHMGKHINIVNLLGACTKNIGKRELMVIVEYCKYGNLHNYLQKHREVFVDTLTDNTESFGKVNRGYSCSSANSGMQSDYFGSHNTQETDNTFVNNTADSGCRINRKISESGYIPDTNYESDSMFDGCRPRPLYSRDLLCWAFQIARGMEYLASRKVLHGDLAARNVLLSDDNIVKICDFGLARSVYKDEEYQKKENCLLPVKWLAIECITDRIFSTQSDVWAYGIVLWELFSLAKTPYPNVSPQNLLEWLSQGKRLEKPVYADGKLYDVMLRCWEHKPTLRPSFSELQELIGTFLEDNVRNHYVDLNATYADFNRKNVGKEDYLQMVCAPDYNKMIAPSPHHYVNDGVVTLQLQHDQDGYLQMSPNQMVLRPLTMNNTKFDFDVKKQKTSEENVQESELTPMLTLNNLPARSGSDSDQEGNPSPYLNVGHFPRIEEETNEVFEEKQNNVKNLQNGVTNLTYITLDHGTDKKPPGKLSNEYINMPNGLVT